jgi:hypothetical protein
MLFLKSWKNFEIEKRKQHPRVKHTKKGYLLTVYTRLSIAFSLLLLGFNNGE